MSALERALQAWSSIFAAHSDVDIDERIRGFAALINGIARRGAVSPDSFAELMSFDAETAREIFAGLSAVGFPTDDAGNMVGAGITTRETPFKLRVLGKDLYAWCALDALLIPGVLSTTAKIEATCPISEEKIRIGVSGRWISSCDPAGIWVSVFLPSDASLQFGPESIARRQMHFFRDRDASEEWIMGRDAVVVMSLDDAFKLARMQWVDRASRAKRARP